MTGQIALQPPLASAGSGAVASAVTDNDLIAVARFLERMGVPELAGNHFPPDTRRREWVLLGIGILGWVGAFLAFFAVASAFDTPDYGKHTSKWYLLMGACLVVGIVALLMRRELRLARTGHGVTRRTRLGTARLAGEITLWLAMVGLGLFEAYGHGPSDPGSVALSAFLVAAIVYRFALRRFTGRNLVTFTLASLRALVEGARGAPRLATTVPLMLGVVVFLFITGDTWKLFGRMEFWRFWWLVGGLTLIVLVSLWQRLPRPLQDLEHWDHNTFMSNALNTPAAPLVRANVNPKLTLQNLRSQTRLSLVAPIWLVRAVRVLASAIALAVILLVIGVLAIGRSETEDMLGTKFIQAVPFTLAGNELVLSDALVKVAILLSLLGAGYFAAVSLSDPAIRTQFLRNEDAQRVAEVLAAWAYFTGALADRAPYLTLAGKPIFRRDLRGVDLRGVDVSGADFDGIDLRGARADDFTKWPQGFDPRARGVKVHQRGFLGRILNRKPDG